jgi:hypothetical protein
MLELIASLSLHVTVEVLQNKALYSIDRCSTIHVTIFDKKLCIGGKAITFFNDTNLIYPAACHNPLYGSTILRR